MVRLSSTHTNALHQHLPRDHFFMSSTTPPHAPGEFVSTAWATHVYRVRRATVFDAIHRGALPAIPVHGVGGAITTYALRPGDLHALWGNRLTAAEVSGDE